MGDTDNYVTILVFVHGENNRENTHTQTHTYNHGRTANRNLKRDE